MRYFKLFLFCLPFFLFFSCKPSHKAIIVEKGILKDFVPLHAVENLYYSRFETSNLEYGIFIDELKYIDSIKWRDCLYDSVQWNLIGGYIQPFERNYHWHPLHYQDAATNIPVTGAMEYCEMLNRKYHSKKRRKFKKVNFRLPTEDEFRKLLKTVKFNYSSDDFSAYKVFKFNVAFPEKYAQDGCMYSCAVYKYVQNDQKACSIVGNVGELLSSGDAFGGDWYSLPSTTKRKSEFSAPDPRIGFRVFMEVIEK